MTDRPGRGPARDSPDARDPSVDARPGAWTTLAVTAAAVAVFLVGARLLGATPIHHDNGSIAYPLRVLVSTALQHGVLPLWDHWTHGGAPLCSLVVALPLSPIVVALGAFGVYRPATFVVELAVLQVLALVGMRRWLSGFADAHAALLGAACYALSAILLVQAPINLEAVASQAMFPWYALGLRESLRGDRRGVPWLAASLWIMFTTGYLGLNLFALEILTAYVVVSHLVVEAGPGEAPRSRRGVAYVCLGWGLFAGIMNPAVLETWRTFGVDLGRIRQTALDPFVGSARPESVFTLFWPNHVSPFLQGADGGHVFPLYAGTIVGLLVLAALSSLPSTWRTSRARRIVVLTAFATLAFSATMTAEWGGRVFTAILPLYDEVRFHAWGLAVVVFLVTTLAALGMTHLRARGGAGGMLVAAFGAVAAGCFVAQRGVRDLAMLPSYAQLYVLPLVALVTWRGVRLRWSARTAVLLGLTLVEIAAVSSQIPSMREGPPPAAAVAARLDAALVARNETSKTDGFPAPPNERTPRVPGNQQYFTKVPALAGYNPNIHPAIRRLQDGPGFPELMGRLFYAADARGLPAVDRPVAVHVRELTPNRVVATIASADPVAHVTWSSPYSAAWRLSVDGVTRDTVANAVGLTGFALDPGSHVVELRYRPQGLVASAIVSVACVLVTLALAVVSRRRERS